MKVIAEIDDPVIARKILEHLGLPAEELELTPARGPPQAWDDEPDAPPPVVEDEWAGDIRDRGGRAGWWSISPLHTAPGEDEDSGVLGFRSTRAGTTIVGPHARGRGGCFAGS